MLNRFNKNLNLAKVFSLGTKSFAKNWRKTTIFRQIDEKIANLPKISSIWRNFSICAKLFFPWEKKLCKKSIWRKKMMVQRFFAKLFVPWEKKLCKNQFDGKKWCCKGNFFPLGYLVNHIEIFFAPKAAPGAKNFKMLIIPKLLYISTSLIIYL